MPSAPHRQEPASALPWVDAFFTKLCGTIAGALRDEARRLSFTLGLAPEPFIPWSKVFSHEVTLGAPWLFAEAMRGVADDAVKHALFAHALAVIEAMGADRIEDRQVRPTAELRCVLSLARALRDEHLARAADDDDVIEDARCADRELDAALRQERELLCAGDGVDFLTYEAVSGRKQAPGLVATVALARRAGWDAGQCAAARQALLDIALALQLYDDVVDWEQDAAAGRCWALSLARSESRSGRRPTDAAGRRAQVHATGVLARMLRRARFRFRAAGRRAAVLGASRLAVWAEERARSLDHIAERETHHAGYANRAHALAPWARAVLAW
jgi:hypothetical protein